MFERQGSFYNREPREARHQCHGFPLAFVFLSIGRDRANLAIPEEKKGARNRLENVFRKCGYVKRLE